MSSPTESTSPFNFVDEVRAEAAAVAEIHVCDVTLRDGEQASDAAFTPAEKLEVAAELELLGVAQIQVGYPRQDGAAVRLIKQAGLAVPLELLCVGFMPTWQADIDVALEAGADVLNILIRSADRQIEFLGLSRQLVVERTVAAIEYARRQGAKTVVFGPSFCTQADLAFLKQLCRAAVEAGAHRVNIADSLGVAMPAAIRFLVRQIRSAVDVPVSVHCHNDFGLAVACTLAGLEGGATWLDVSVNGIGERGGNASLEEVLLALRCLYGLDPGLHTERLFDLSRTVSRLLGVPVPGNKAVVGDNAFAQKLDIHVMVASQDPRLFEPYDPNLVGNRRWIRLGKGSGPFAVRAKLAQLGLSASDDQVQRLVAWVNETAERTKSYVTDESFVRALQ